MNELEYVMVMMFFIWLELWNGRADVQRVSCDQWKQKVTVTSSIAAEKLLARLQKIKKRSTFWPQQVAGAVTVFNGNQVNQQQKNQTKSNLNDNENQDINDENSSVQVDN